MGNWLSDSLKSFNPVAAGMDFVTDNISYAIQSAQNYNYQRKLQQHQFDWQEKMWHMNNEYNSPINQVKRLDEGGLNPNLAYGSLSGNLAQQPSGGTPGFSGGKGHQGHASQTYAAKIAEAVQLKELNERKRVNDAVVDKEKAQASLFRNEAALRYEDWRRKNIDNENYLPYAQDTAYFTFRQQFNEVNRLDKEISRLDGEIKNLGASYDEIMSRINLNKKQGNYYSAAASNQASQAALNVAKKTTEEIIAKLKQKELDYFDRDKQAQYIMNDAVITNMNKNYALAVKEFALKEELTFAQIEEINQRVENLIVEGRISQWQLENLDFNKWTNLLLRVWDQQTKSVNASANVIDSVLPL